MTGQQINSDRISPLGKSFCILLLIYNVCADYKETVSRLIQGHVRVEFARPGIDAAVEIDQIVYRVLLQV